MRNLLYRLGFVVFVSSSIIIIVTSYHKEIFDFLAEEKTSTLPIPKPLEVHVEETISKKNAMTVYRIGYEEGIRATLENLIASGDVSALDRRRKIDSLNFIPTIEILK